MRCAVLNELRASELAADKKKHNILVEMEWIGAPREDMLDGVFERMVRRE